MVKLRLKRMGSKFNAFYRIVATDSKSPRDGRFIEEVGYYNPNSKELKIEKDLVFKWLNNGAQPTDIVRNLLKKENVWTEYLLTKTTKPKKTKNRKKPTKSNEEKSKSSKTKITTKK